MLAQIWEAGVGNKKLMFLDEPVSHLDVKYQHQLLRAATNHCRQYTTVIAILHDINLAIAYADRILFMKQGCILYDIAQLSDFSPTIVKEVFDVECSVFYPDGHLPVVVF